MSARIVDVVRGALLDNWGTKITAIVLALVVFIVTRDEIHRTFSLPLRVIQDPDRVLMTELPETVSVEIRGPWQHLNRLDSREMGSATLDLTKAREGPLEIDRASIVMPHGVILESLNYDPVDLRFDDVIERQLTVRPDVVGSVSEDHELMSVEVEPQVWGVRGGRSVVAGLDELSTQKVDLSGIEETLETQVDVLRPGDGVFFSGVLEGASPRVTIRARVRPRSGNTELMVPVLSSIASLVPELDPKRDGIPASEKVVVRGPQSALRELQGVAAPLVPEVTVERKEERVAIELRFVWSEEVSASARSDLSFEPSLVRFTVETDQEL